MIHELFRGLERTIHERLEIIEEMVRRGPSGPSGPTGPVRQGPTGAEPWSAAISHRLEALERRECPDIDKIMRGHQYLLARIDALEEELRNKPSSLIPPHPLVGIEIIPKKEVTLVDPNPERINEADRLLLNSSARKALEQEEEEEEQAEEEVVAEEVDELAEEAEEAEEELVEEEEEAEDEAEELEEFEYKGATYYRDGEKNVFMTDEDGELIPTPIGVWSEVKKRIIIKKPDA